MKVHNEYKLVYFEENDGKSTQFKKKMGVYVYW